MCFKLLPPFLLLLIALNLPAQIQDLRFLHYDMDDGLAYNVVNRVFQDSRGYIWMATELGLSRFDGIEFKNYYHRWGDSTSLSENRIPDILEDSLGYLWVTTRDGGLNRFDPRTEAFKSYRKIPGDSTSIPDNYLRCMLLDPDHKGIWIGTYRSGLVFFNFAHESFTQFLPIIDNRQRNMFQLDAIIQDPVDKDKLWLGDVWALYQFDKKLHSFNYYRPKHEYGKKASKSIYTSNGQDIWIGTWGGGLEHFHIPSDSWKYYLPRSREYLGQKNVILDILPKSSTELWVTDYSYGLGLFNIETGAFDFAVPDPALPYKLVSKNVKSPFYDQQGILWISTKGTGSGVHLVSPAFNQTHHLELPSFTYNNEVKSMTFTDVLYVPESRNTLLSLDRGCGILLFDEHMKQSEWVPFSSKLDDNPLGFLFQDRAGRIWTTNRNRLWHFDLRNHSFIPVLEEALAKLPHRPAFFKQIYEHTDGTLWLGTGHGGLLKISPDLDSIEQFIASEENPDYPDPAFIINNIAWAPNGILWMTFWRNGLASFHPDTKTFRRFSFESGHLIDFENQSLYIDSDGTLWLGTNSYGIQIFDPEQEKTIRVLDRNDGLTANSIRQMATDKNGNLWIGSVHGIMQYNLKTGKLRTFTEKEGLLYTVNEYLYIGPNDFLYTGFRKRFNYFNIDSLDFNPMPPPIVFQSLKVNNKEWLLKPGIDYQKEIELKHDQNIIAISFAALNYINPLDNEYSYSLEGVDRDWQYTRGRNRTATYANLSPGTYTFHLKAANNDGLWNEYERQLILKIRPPWWGTPTAYAGYIIVILGLIYTLYTFQLRRRLAMAEAQRLREVDQAKTRLYTNITHEFRTPLTVIMGMADQIVKKLPKAYLSAEMMGGYFKMIKRNAQQLLDLVNQMLDLRKLETGTLKLQLIQSDILPLLQYICESFQSLAETKGIQLVFYSEIDQLIMDFDPEQLKKVLSNLLSNAVKFTPEGGKVYVISNTLGVFKTPRVLEIKIKDTGIGIAPTDIPHLFDRFYQVDTSSTRQGEGTGIGLALVKELVDLMQISMEVESEQGKGTTFILTLPVTKEAPTSVTSFSSSPYPLYPQGFQNPGGIAKSEEMPLCLIVEDNADVAEYISTCLKKDYRLEWAKDGEDGIEKAIGSIPDILISDVMMPRKNGLELCDTLKQDERTSHIPIILLTAKATQADKIEGLEHGADAYLIKPFDQKELEVRLQKLIQLRQKLRERYSNLENIGNNPTDSKEAAFLHKLQQIVEAHLEEEDFGVVPLSEAMHLSRMQVHRKLKALTNLSTTQFIRKIRLQHGRKLLKNTQLTIAEIAYQVGFRDPNYFSRVFLQEYGISPTSIRK